MFITYGLPNLGHTFSIIVKTHNYDGTEQLMVLCVYFHFHSLFHLLSAAKYWTAGHYHNDCTYYMVFAHTQCDHINQVYIEALLLERWNLFSPGRSRFSDLLWLLSQLSVITAKTETEKSRGWDTCMYYRAFFFQSVETIVFLPTSYEAQGGTMCQYFNRQHKKVQTFLGQIDTLFHEMSEDSSYQQQL